MKNYTRIITILDDYAYREIIAEVYSKSGTQIYKGPAMDVPYGICTCYAKNHFFDKKQLIIKIQL